MKFWAQFARSVLYHLFFIGGYALNYFLARWWFDANPAWAAGYAIVTAVIIVGVPKWGGS